MSGGVLIANEARELLLAKWEKGHREHGGDLFRKPVLHEAIEEAVDQIAYLLVERRQKARVAVLLAEALELAGDLPPAVHDRIRAAFNLVTFGNAEGD